MGRAPRGGILVTLFVFGLALAVAPGWTAPFSTPKAIVVGLFALAAVAEAVIRRRSPIPSAVNLGALIWVASAAIGSRSGQGDPMALLLISAAALLTVAGPALELSPEKVLVPLAAAGVPVAVVVLLQRGGLDPFAALGFVPTLTGTRLRLYGTLGNPDFVAGFLAPASIAAAGLFALGRHRRWLAIALFEGLALALLGSFASLLALGAGAAVWLWARPRAAHLALAAAVLALVAVGTFGRALPRTVEGRRYVWSVALPHLLEAPVFGHGPGASYRLWAKWEAERHAPDPRFSASLTHLHCDPLEVALDEGLLGLAGLVLLLGAAVREALRRARTEPAALAAGCALVAILARAFVDFSLQRPAELGLAVLLVLAVRQAPAVPETETCSVSVPSPSRSSP